VEPDTAREIAFSRLMEECFKINRQLVAAVGKLTDGSGITGPQWGVLGELGGPHAPLTVAQAARHLGMARQGVQRVADLLQEKGLIEYVENPSHRRAKLAAVTVAGRQLLTRLQEHESQWAQEAAGGLNPDDVQAATRLIRSIRLRLIPQVPQRQSNHTR
jgi:DNA-binding MarR family transcriptional regulator